MFTNRRLHCIISGVIFMLLATLQFSQASAADKPKRIGVPSDEPIELVAPTGIINGTLLLPAKQNAVVNNKHGLPLVIIYAGSGPTDRDGNTARAAGKNDSLKMLALAFAENSIASLRFDKRGVAKSADAGSTEKDLRFDQYVDDLSRRIKKMRTDTRFSRIIVAGHSEGSLIGMMAVATAKADAFVSVAGIARSAGEVLRTQLKPRLSAPLWDESERVLAALESGKTVDDPLPHWRHFIDRACSHI